MLELQVISPQQREISFECCALITTRNQASTRGTSDEVQ